MSGAGHADRRPAVLVAIDGPAGVGKSSAARRVASVLGIPYLDTGAMYRALALRALEAGIDPDDGNQVTALLEGLDLDLRPGPDGPLSVHLDGQPVGDRIRAPRVGEATSRLAVHPAVRARMVELQRRVAGREGAVVEGRDIGTRVFPQTPHKFFLVAAPDVRFARRHRELEDAGRRVTRAEVEREIEQRDARDAARDESPMQADPSYRVIDTSHQTLDQVVDAIVDAVRRAAPA